MKNLITMSVLFVSMVITTSLQAQTKLPETPAGVRAKEIVKLLNGTSSYKLDDYIQNQYTPEFRDAFPVATHKSIFSITQTMFGKVKVVDITKSKQNEISLVLKSETKEAWLNLVLQVESDDPHRVVSMGLMPGARPSNSETEEEIKQDK